MRVLRNASASRTTIASLAVLYLVVVVLTVLVSERLVLQPVELSGRFAIVFAGIGLIFPTILLVAIAASIVRLVRERRARRPGSGFKGRLTAFFALMVVLAAVPQGIISVVTLSSALETVLASDTGQAIRGGLDLALSYYDEQVQALEVLAEDELIRRAAAERRFEDLYRRVVRRIPRTVALEVYDVTGESLWFRGDARYQGVLDLPPSAATRGPARINRIAIPTMSILRLVAPVEGEGFFVLNSVLPQNFEMVARNLSEAATVFGQLESLRPNLLFAVAGLYMVFASPLFLLAILAGFFLSDRIMRPIESLEAATRQVAEGDYSVRILVRAHDDLGLLVQSFNRMVTELDRSRKRLAQTEKVQAWQEIAQRLAHEVKNPLTPIRLAAERLRRRYESGSEDFGEVLHRTVATIVREVDLLSGMLNEFRSFTRMPEPQIADIHLAPLLREVAMMFADRGEVRIDSDGVDPNLTIRADRGQIRQVVLNLFTNAVEAGGGKVRVLCRTDLVQKGDATYARLRVEDDGPGIPQTVRETIFDPYVTTKEHGTGLGLAIVERIIFDHNGQISVESVTGVGTSFVIDLPSSDRISPEAQG